MPKTYYVRCEDDCLYEGMTKEQILTAIEQAVETGAVSDPDSAVISKIKEIRANGTAQFWIGTEAQFNALSPAPSVGYTFVRIGADGIMYICTDDDTSESLLTHAANKNNPHEVTAAQVGAAPSSHTHGNINADGTLNVTTGNQVVVINENKKITSYGGATVCNMIGAQKKVTASTTDLTAGSSTLATGEVYLVYE